MRKMQKTTKFSKNWKKSQFFKKKFSKSAIFTKLCFEIFFENFSEEWYFEIFFENFSEESPYNRGFL